MSMRLWLAIGLLFVSGLSYAGPLIIVPTYPLPTTILPGGTVDAYYTVSNNTLSVQNNVFVKHLPAHVTQVTNDPSFCGATFDLQAYNTPGSSCILKLVISAPVDADPDDLLVCLRDGLTCACTDYPLDVSEDIEPLPAMAVGSSFNFELGVQTDFLPLAYTSVDQGNRWQLSHTFTLPALQTAAQLLGVSCNVLDCTSVGFAYNTVNVDNIPLGYTSIDGGRNWSGPRVFNTINPNTMLDDVSCVGLHCTAVGSHGSAPMPVAYTSSDGGKNWFISASFTLTGSLFGVSCNSNNCVAVGSTIVSPQPIVFTSVNNGHNWTQSSLPSGGTQLNDVSCMGLICVAVGQSGLGLYSTDGGNNWTASTGLLATASFNAVSCILPNCNAVGQTSVNLPISYISMDSGVTWNPSITTPMPVPSSHQGGLLALACLGTNNCITGGSSFISPHVAALPLSYFSQNMGGNWQLSQSLSLPSGQTSGVLNDMAFTF